MTWKPRSKRHVGAKTEDFTQSFDAMVWAEAFVEHVRKNPRIATDAGTMVGWFANALMRGFDEHAKREGSHPSPFAAVQALEGLVTRWQGEAASCRARFFDDLQAPSMLPTRAVAYSMCADELADALATLRQREDTTR